MLKHHPQHRPGLIYVRSVQLRVANSQSKFRLYFGNLPHAWSKDQITEEVNKHAKGIAIFRRAISLHPCRKYVLPLMQVTPRKCGVV